MGLSSHQASTVGHGCVRNCWTRRQTAPAVTPTTSAVSKVRRICMCTLLLGCFVSSARLDNWTPPGHRDDDTRLLHLYRRADRANCCGQPGAGSEDRVGLPCATTTHA